MFDFFGSPALRASETEETEHRHHFAKKSPASAGL